MLASQEEVIDKQSQNSNNSICRLLNYATCIMLLFVAIGIIGGTVAYIARLDLIASPSDPTTPEPLTNSTPTPLIPPHTSEEDEWSPSPVLRYASNPAVAKDYLIGVYYYPWYNLQGHRKGPFHTQGGSYIRRELNPPQFPVLGEYDDSRHETINKHVEWSTYAGINLWVASFFSPETDLSIRNVILNNQNFIDSDIKLAIHFESYARMKPTRNELDDEHLLDLSNIYPDMIHIATNYFDNPKYLRLKNRPVIVLYVTRSLHSKKYFKILDDVIGTMRQAAADQGHPDIFIVGDQIWRDAPEDIDTYEPFQYLDAVTNYDIRNQMAFDVPYASVNDTNTYFQKQIDWRNAAKKSRHNKVSFIPAIMPGFNKRGQAPSTPVNKRAHSRRIQSQSKPNGSFFERLLLNALTMTSKSAGNMLLINSWNEYHEDSQIEPVGNTSNKLNEEIQCTDKPLKLTEGVEYCEYDHLFLNIIRENTIFANQSTCYGGGSHSLIVTNGAFEGEVFRTSDSSFVRTSKTTSPWHSHYGGNLHLATIYLETEDESILDYSGTYSTRVNTYIKIQNRRHEDDGISQIHSLSTCMFQVGQKWNIEARIKLEGDQNYCNPEIINDCPSLHWVFSNMDTNKEIVTKFTFDKKYKWKTDWNVFSKDITITSNMVPSTAKEILMSLSPTSQTTIKYTSVWVGGSNNNKFADFVLDDFTYSRIYPSSRESVKSRL